MDPRRPLLDADAPPAFEVVNARGRSTAVLTCDHASHVVPPALRDLGLSREQLLDHIGWDPGAADVARRLSGLLDAPLVLSGYSRLVIDCNRPPGAPTSIPAESGGVRIPGNSNVSADDAHARAGACFWPYHRAIESLLDARAAERRPTHVLAIHSFTPVMLGTSRPWTIGVLYGRDDWLAHRLLDELRRDPDLVVGDNEPYRVTDASDYGIPMHAERREHPGALIEIRNDGPRTPAGVEYWANVVASAYRAVAGSIDKSTGAP